MDRASPYYRQVQLLIRVLPFVFQEDCFALKGGTAINLFVRNFPRLSVDIDLVYLPDKGRDEALADIRRALDTVAESIVGALEGVTVTCSYQDKSDALRLIVSQEKASIKVELSPVLRGTVYPPETRSVVEAVEDEFGFAEVPVVALADLYAGKLCAALDRQHPRDWFDVMLLARNEGVTEALRKAFLVYLVSHPRPMEELLAPNWKQQDALFESEFRGMAFVAAELAEMQAAVEDVLDTILAGLTEEQRRFLCSIYESEPVWSLLDLEGVSSLPAVRWKLRNVARMDAGKRAASLGKLKEVLAAK